MCALKDFSFVEDEENRKELLERARDLCRQLIHNPSASLSQGTLSQADVMDTTSPSSQEKRMETLFGDLSKTSTEKEADEKNEADLYLKKKPVAFAVGGKITDRLEWWKMHQTKYPKLSKLARRSE
jgi:hypothetical protein